MKTYQNIAIATLMVIGMAACSSTPMNGNGAGTASMGNSAAPVDGTVQAGSSTSGTTSSGATMGNSTMGNTDTSGTGTPSSTGH